MLQQTRNALASDSRDQLFAITGLLLDDETILINPDMC
jgi:hypothetical protein